MTNAHHNGSHQVVMVNPHERFAPLLCESALDLKKFVVRPSLERLFLLATSKNDALLVAELHWLPTRNHRPLQNPAQVELSS